MGDWCQPLPGARAPGSPAQRSAPLAAFAGLYAEALPPRCWAADSRRAVLGTPQRSRTVSPGHGRARDVTTAHGDTAACALHPHRTCCSWIRRRALSPTSQQVRGTGHPWCSSEQLWSPTRVLSPGSSEGCWELLTLQWDLLVATCSAPHHPPSLVSSALAPCGTVGYGAAMCSQAQLSVAHTPWCGVA